MNAIDEALDRLRAVDPLAQAGLSPDDDDVAAELRASGVAFATAGESGFEDRWHRALAELRDCIADTGGTRVLREGGAYQGAWLESTATIGAEVLDRFAPGVTRATHLAFAAAQRDDGLLPYKLTADGPAFTQIQTVTPLARCVWRHYLRTGRDRTYLARMRDAVARNDAWLAAHRDTRGTGAVEAFCTFDTGHDLSPRFWGIPDRCFHGDAARFDPGIPALPFVAPDLTAAIACQREQLAGIESALAAGDALTVAQGEARAADWRAKAAASLAALERECRVGGTYYDRAADGSHVRIDSDVLLRVLACGVGDDAQFAAALADDLMSTHRFLSAAGFTSIALDDPRFDGDHTRNSWAGPVNALTMLRAPDAFEAHGRVAELALAHRTLLAAMADHDRFAQCYDPWTADAGYTEAYSPSILLYLDLLERDAGILPLPDGRVWLTGLVPVGVGARPAAATAARRIVAGVRYELAGDETRVEVHRDGERWLGFPRGWRIELDAAGVPVAVTCVAATAVAGDLRIGGTVVPLALGPNDRARLHGAVAEAPAGPGFVAPHA